MTIMQDQPQARCFARQSEFSSPAGRPETIPEIARYLGITTETLSQLAAHQYLRERQTSLRSRPALAAAPY
jgi:hypothetical protein